MLQKWPILKKKNKILTEYADYRIHRDNNFFIGRLGKIKFDKHSNRFELDNIYRNIIFTLNAENLANDLLYTSPNYPIIDMSKNVKFCKSMIAISDPYDISILVRYFGDVEITLDDILAVRNTFFINRVNKNNWNSLINDLVNCCYHDGLKIDHELLKYLRIPCFDKHMAADRFKPHQDEMESQKIKKYISPMPLTNPDDFPYIDYFNIIDD